MIGLIAIVELLPFAKNPGEDSLNELEFESNAGESNPEGTLLRLIQGTALLHQRCLCRLYSYAV